RFRAGQFLAAYKYPNGDIVYQAATGEVVRVDARGKEIKSFKTPTGGSQVGAMDVSPGGLILLTEPEDHVNAYDPADKLLFQVEVQGVTTASWLANGNVLAASCNNRKVVELDRAGRVVWAYQSEQNVFRARRR